MTAPAIGLVGFGRWGRLIHRDLRALGATVHVAVPSGSGRADAVAAGAASVCVSAAELPDLDGYVVAAPTGRHADVLDVLIPRGRPIFVEKPMTADVESARRVAEAAAGRLFVMDKWRYHPGVEELARLARSGAFGRVLAVRTYRLGWGNPHRDVDAVWILLPHDLSIALEILGGLPEVRSAFAPPGPVAGSDLICTLQDPGGPFVTCEISISHPAARRAVVVVGDQGSGQLADSYDDAVLLAGRVDGVEIDESNRLRQVGVRMPLEAELAAFLGHVAGGPPPRSSAAEGLAVVRAVDAARRLAGLS